MITLYEEIADTSRRLLLLSLDSGPQSVSELVQSTGLKQANVSNHLARLRSRDLVKCQRFGRKIIYSLFSAEVGKLVHILARENASPELPLDLPMLAHEFAEAAVASNEAKCNDIFDRLFAAKTELIDIYEEVVRPAMSDVGEWWIEGKIDEAHEHAASELAHRMLDKTSEALALHEGESLVAIVGCGPGNWHVLGLTMVADFLRSLGWTVISLGANTPTAPFVKLVEQYKPDLVVTNCSAEASITETLELIVALRAKSEQIHFKIAVGGPQVVRDATPFARAGAHFCAQNLRDFADNFLPELVRMKAPAEA